KHACYAPYECDASGSRAHSPSKPMPADGPPLRRPGRAHLRGPCQCLANIAKADNCVAHNIFSFGLLSPTAPRTIEGRPQGVMSDLRQAAVDGELAGGHEAAVGRRKKGRRRSDLRRISHALERIHRGEDLQAFL